MDLKLLNTLRFELDRYLNADDDEQERHRAKLVKCVDELLRQPVGAGEGMLRRFLDELRPALAERRVSASYVQLVRELEKLPRAGVKAVEVPRTDADAARELLRGRALLVIGGIPRPEHMENLRSTFELSEVVWPETSETKPTHVVLEPYIARADVAAVVLLIRWIRHALNEVAELCELHGKPLVRAPGGYNVNQIAKLVVEQAKRRGE
ncbi:MAG: hypothetical protein IPJ77_06470 [Planctomycetes bacterium]|nr:hypothetical protein [Planctomycetota bacterium]